MSDKKKKEALKKDGYFVLRDSGSTFYDETQGKSLNGKVPAHLKLTPKVRKAAANNYLKEVTEAQFKTRLKELNMEVKSGVVVVKLGALTKNQQAVLDSALELEVIVKRNGAFFLEKERIAAGEGGLVKKLKDRKFAARLKKEIEIAKLAAEEPEEETTTDDTPAVDDNSEGSEDTPGDDNPTADTTGTDETDLETILAAAVVAELVTTDGGTYLFGEFALGANDAEAVEFLGAEANADVLNQIKSELAEKDAE